MFFTLGFIFFTLAAAVIEWGICWLLILLELIAGSGGVVFAMFSYSTHCSVSFYFLKFREPWREIVSGGMN